MAVAEAVCRGNIMGNEMNRVAKILGVELCEDFRIAEYGEEEFWLTETGLYLYDRKTCANVYKPEILSKLLAGEYHIIVKLKLPKKSSSYFYLSFLTTDNVEVKKTTWIGCAMDLMNFKCGNVFFTYTEALDNAGKFVKMLVDSKADYIDWRNGGNAN